MRKKTRKKEEVEDNCGLSSLRMKEILIVVPNKAKTNKQTNLHCGSYLLLVTEQLGSKSERMKNHREQ